VLVESSWFQQACRLSKTVNVDSATADASTAAAPAATFELYNADTNQKIVDLTNGTVIALSDDMLSNGGPMLNIVVRFPTNVNLGSVQFGLDTNASFHLEYQAPFALCGNRGSAGFFSCDEGLLGAVPGTSHTVIATPYKPKRRKRFSFFRTGGAAIPAGDAESVTFTFAAHNIPTVLPFCGSIASCVDCLKSNCAWAVNFACIDSCTNGVLDTTCYDTKANMSNSSSFGAIGNMNASKALLVSQQLCTLAERDHVDIALCDQQRNCTACINTNGTTTSSSTAVSSTRCHWISRRTIQNNPSIGYCSIDMCSAPFGFGPCGSTTCPSPS
jgi:hypothetical protein